jgi:hypothetical protein
VICPKEMAVRRRREPLSTSKEEGEENEKGRSKSPLLVDEAGDKLRKGMHSAVSPQS